jgi:hypothetical protein
MGNRNRSDTRRRSLAHEAARIMADQGDADFERARRKAAERAAVTNRRLWPSNEEIRDAFLERQRLFEGRRQAAELTRLRREALEGMRHFATFSPRLVGPVLDGSADRRHAVRLLLFADHPEEVVFELMERRIPWEQREEGLRFGGGVRRSVPLLSLYAGETRFELLVLPPSARHNPPLDPVSERPERGVDADELERLIDEPGPEIGEVPGPGGGRGR